MTNITFSLKPFVDRISETDLENLCQENPEARLEINKVLCLSKKKHRFALSKINSDRILPTPIFKASYFIPNF